MPKIKTKKSAQKRFKYTKNGKLKRYKAFASHTLEKKSSDRKRNFRRSAVVEKADEKRVKKMLPYSTN